MTARVLLAILPVLALLAALLWMDSYKLVRPRVVASLLGMGAAVALVCYLAGSAISPLLPYYDRAGAPLLEETLKAAVLLEAVRRRRVAFLADAAIAGFAVGAGFALVENLYYASVLGEASPFIYALRGFGTAVMHGGATALVGIGMRNAAGGWRGPAAGFSLAVAIHLVYNLGLLAPALSAAAVLVAVPVLLAAALARGEARLRRWLGEGFDDEVELLAVITGGAFLETRAGAYLKSLQSHFPPAVAADMLCLVQLSVELSIRAKAELLKREAGCPPVRDPSVAGKLRELRYLEHSVGPAARRVVAPLPGGAARRAWQLKMLRETL
jgi:RsiW-degrading membrane proteinase PrsW (M82 family)